MDRVSPRRLGSGVRYLLASSIVTNASDGIALAAGPLLVASVTTDPVLVAGAVVLQRLPWLLFGLYAGAVADRLDRRRIIVVANLARSAVLIALTLFILSDSVDVIVVLAAMFLLGTAETFVDSTTETLLPMMVTADDLSLVNSRLIFNHVAVNQMVGPALGGALFATGMFVPFAAQAVAVAMGALLIGRIALEPLPRTTAFEQRPARTEIAEGFRWLLGHPPMRTLALTIVAFNITFGAAWAILVLYSSERLGLGDIGFALLTASSAAGGIVGSLGFGRLERLTDHGNLMRAGLAIETLTHLGLALTTTAWVAFVVLFFFGIHTSMWGVISTTIRQRAVPGEFQGRVGSVYRTGLQGSLVVGSALGGVLADRWGLTAPFWFGFVGSAVILALIWRALSEIAHA